MDITSVSTKVSDYSCAGRKKFISTIKSEFTKSPLASNAVLALILAGLEKLVELDFTCPCDPTWNVLFVSAYFICPGVIASVLMLFIQGCKRETHREHETFALFGSVPTLVWVILMFLDGQYYACGKTNWSGKFVNVDKAAPEKWCEPDNTTLSLEKMKQTQQWLFHSQFIGLGLLAVSLFVLAAFGVYKYLLKKEPDGAKSPKEPAMEEEMEAL